MGITWELRRDDGPGWRAQFRSTHCRVTLFAIKGTPENVRLFSSVSIGHEARHGFFPQFWLPFLWQNGLKKNTKRGCKGQWLGVQT